MSSVMGFFGVFFWFYRVFYWHHLSPSKPIINLLSPTISRAKLLTFWTVTKQLTSVLSEEPQDPTWQNTVTEYSIAARTDIRFHQAPTFCACHSLKTGHQVIVECVLWSKWNLLHCTRTAKSNFLQKGHTWPFVGVDNFTRG